MKIEDAISWFEHRKNSVTMPGARKMYDAALEALHEKQECENQKPLSLEQVSVMCGEPLYVIPLEKNADWESHWAIMQIDSVTASSISTKSRMYFLYEKDYGKTWLAYKNKPEQEKK